MTDSRDEEVVGSGRYYKKMTRVQGTSDLYSIVKGTRRPGEGG